MSFHHVRYNILGFQGLRHGSFGGGDLILPTILSYSADPTTYRVMSDLALIAVSQWEELRYEELT